MAERVNLVELRGAIEKATAEVLENRVVRREPIVVGVAAPEAISAEDAQAIAEKVAAASGLGGKPTVIRAGASHEDERKAALPNTIRIIIGLIFS